MPSSLYVSISSGRRAMDADSSEVFYLLCAEDEQQSCYLSCLAGGAPGLPASGADASGGGSPPSTSQELSIGVVQGFSMPRRGVGNPSE